MTLYATERVYVGLGSNLEDPLLQVQAALSALDRLADTQLINHSPWYRSKAVGPGEQPDYINGVAELETSLPPEQLLSDLHGIEIAQGRIRNERWAARTIDLDILLYGNQIVATDRLRIPHPRLHQRNFVLYPLADLAPLLVFPDGRKLATLVAECPNTDIEKL
jgi:2-amino-4-hydroxy-6-hydroxymethyldihydropteridine diphosphokinase